MPRNRKRAAAGRWYQILKGALRPIEADSNDFWHGQSPSIPALHNNAEIDGDVPVFIWIRRLVWSEQAINLVQRLLGHPVVSIYAP